MSKDKSKKWAEYTPDEYLEAILAHDNDSAAIAYYLINNHLRRLLKTVFVNVGGENYWEFQDTIEDFFLYVYDGSNWMYNRPFYMLESIEKKESLFSWMKMTYRNFLIRNLNEELRKKSVDQKYECCESEIFDDEKIMYLSTAIAYADQNYMSRNRFVMYRLLLTFLNRSLALSQEDIAEAIDMQPVAYRVSTKRVKDNMLNNIRCMEQGIKFELDTEHKMMRDTIASNFDDLYSTLELYYDKAIDSLPMANKINELRYGYGVNCMHEETPPYGFCNTMTASELYFEFKKFCKG